MKNLIIILIFSFIFSNKSFANDIKLFYIEEMRIGESALLYFSIERRLKMEDVAKWSIDDMVEVKLKEDDDFLKVKETLTRIGIASRKEKKLFQSCHILHKQGKYYIVHFKELFALDGKPTNISENDIERRNTIANLLHEWELVKLVVPEKAQPTVPIRQLKILPFGEKEEWDLQAKYSIGNVGIKSATEKEAKGVTELDNSSFE